MPHRPRKPRTTRSLIFKVPEAISGFDLLPDSAGVRPIVAAKLLDCHIATIWRLIARGHLEAARVSERVTNVRVGSLRRLMSDGIKAPAEAAAPE